MKQNWRTILQERMRGYRCHDGVGENHAAVKSSSSAQSPKSHHATRHGTKTPRPHPQTIRGQRKASGKTARPRTNEPGEGLRGVLIESQDGEEGARRHRRRDLDGVRVLEQQQQRRQDEHPVQRQASGPRGQQRVVVDLDTCRVRRGSTGKISARSVRDGDRSWQAN